MVDVVAERNTVVVVVVVAVVVEVVVGVVRTLSWKSG